LVLTTWIIAMARNREGWPIQRQLTLYSSLGKKSDFYVYPLLQSGLVFDTCIWESYPVLVIASRMELHGGKEIEDWITSMRYMIDAFEWK